MSDNSNNVHFSGLRFICSPYLAITLPHFARADNGRMRAANESYTLEMNIIVIINSGQKDVEVFCVALVTYKLTIIYKINDPSAKYVNLKKKF